MSATKEHKIQWLNLPGYKGETWNPIIGCSKVSEGCRNCYAEKMAFRIAHIEISGHKELNYAKVVGIGANRSWNGETQMVESQLTKPLSWKKPRIVFVCSMGDLFHESIPFEWTDRIFKLMYKAKQHKFIILTKRPKQMIEYFKWVGDRAGCTIYDMAPSKDSNLIFGVSIEDQKTADQRIPLLLSLPVTNRMISIEPMLGPLDLTPFLPIAPKGEIHHTDQYLEKEGRSFPQQGEMSEGQRGLSWVICGGESGSAARPMHPDWVRSVRDQCQAAGVPFFFKQWGEWLPAAQNNVNENLSAKRENIISMSAEGDYGPYFKTDYMVDDRNYKTIAKIGRKAAGNLLDGVKHEEYAKIN